MSSFVPTLPPTTNGNTPKPGATPALEYVDPRARAARANWLAAHGDGALAIVHRAELVREGLCVYCGEPLHSLASLRRGAGEACARKYRQ
jgi:hypothetical protein